MQALGTGMAGPKKGARGLHLFRVRGAGGGERVRVCVLVVWEVWGTGRSAHMAGMQSRILKSKHRACVYAFCA